MLNLNDNEVNMTAESDALAYYTNVSNSVTALWTEGYNQVSNHLGGMHISCPPLVNTTATAFTDFNALNNTNMNYYYYEANGSYSEMADGELQKYFIYRFHDFFDAICPDGTLAANDALKLVDNGTHSKLYTDITNSITRLKYLYDSQKGVFGTNTRSGIASVDESGKTASDMLGVFNQDAPYFSTVPVSKKWMFEIGYEAITLYTNLNGIPGAIPGALGILKNAA